MWRTSEAEKVAFLLGINSADLLKALLKPKIKVRVLRFVLSLFLNDNLISYDMYQAKWSKSMPGQGDIYPDHG